jgi:hypothetical protein
MGYLTTFTVYNDGCHDIPTHAREFTDAVFKACSSHKTKSYPIGSHANLIKAQKTRHADDKTVYVHAGNTVCEMNFYSDETQELVERNPEFAKEMIDLMQFHATQLKKLYKHYHGNKKK